MISLSAAGVRASFINISLRELKAVVLPIDVRFFMAKKTGSAGRAGNTVGTLVSENLECSANARKLPPLAYSVFNREAARLKRIETIEPRSRTFIADLRDAA